MKTPIGQALHQSRETLYRATMIGVVVVVSDVLLAWRFHPLTMWRWSLPLVALGLYGRLCGWDEDSLGFRIKPIQGMLYWIVAALLIGGAMLICIGLYLGAMGLLGRGIELPAMTPRQFERVFVPACVHYPVLEEAVYRFALCVPAARLLRPEGAIILSGSVFALLHFVYGTAGPDNFVAGYFLAWAFLKSGCLFVPIVLHSLGNGIVLFSELAAWYLSSRG